MMETIHIVALGAFGAVVLMFCLLQFRILSKKTHAKPEEAQNNQAQEAFRDELMARLLEELRGAPDVKLTPADPISFELEQLDGSRRGETMLVVLVNVYSGCVKYPRGAVQFKEHFVRDLVSTIRSEVDAEEKL